MSLIFLLRFPGTGMPAGSSSCVGNSACPLSLAVSIPLPISWRTLFVLKRLDHEPREDMEERDTEGKLVAGEDAGCTHVGDRGWLGPSFHERGV